MPGPNLPSEALLSPTAISRYLKQHGLAPRHKMGQNFLIDPRVLKAILSAADLTREDVALEVGPGLGVLTRALAEQAGRVVALELDPGLLGLLRQELVTLDNLSLVEGDALEVDLNAVLAENPPGPGGRTKVVANLPYYITSPFLFRLLEETGGWERAVLMVQREVADRLLAPPGGKTYGTLTLAVRYYAEAELVTHVGRGSFWPAPDVESAVVRLVRRAEPPVVAPKETLFAAIRAGFGQRRKTLGNALSSRWPKDQVQAALQAAGIDPARRGETLSLEEFAALAVAMDAVAASRG